MLSAAFDASSLDEPRFVTETGIAAHVARVAEPVLNSMGLRLVRVRILSNTEYIVQIMAERPDGTMTVGDCEKASLELSPILDVENVITHAWMLEISSPGMDRPLVRLSDFYRALSHEAKIETKDVWEGRKRFKGWIEAVEGEGSATCVHVRLTDSLVHESADVRIPLSEIAQAHLILTQALVREALKASEMALKARTLEGEALPPPVRRGPGRFSKERAGLERSRKAKRRDVGR